MPHIVVTVGVSIAQARHPFMQPTSTVSLPVLSPGVSIAQARHPFMQRTAFLLTSNFFAMFQSLKRDIPLCNASPVRMVKPELVGFNRSSATSLYATRRYAQINLDQDRFQSLKRDIPLCNHTRDAATRTYCQVSIAQARHPFMQLRRRQVEAVKKPRFNRS